MKKMENNKKRKTEELQEMNQTLDSLLTEEEKEQGAESLNANGRRRHSEKKHGSKSEKKGRGWKIALLVILLLMASSVGAFLAFYNAGKNSLLAHEMEEEVEVTAPEEAEVILEDDGQKVSYKGKKYRRKEEVISILCLGVDRTELAEDGGLIGENGQSDTVLLAALDTETGHMTLINISRDSMVEVDRYNENGEYVNTEEMQLCLAFAYGDGRESSCKNTMKSVSRLLYGIPVDAYAAIDLPAITVLNDAVGGVQVECLEDFSNKYPEMTLGATVTLQGQQAETYVRSRDVEGPNASADSNNRRMARQKQYLMAFITKALQATKEDLSVPLALYQAITSYMVTDITPSRVTYLASLVLEGGFRMEDMVTVPGTAQMGEIYAEYHVDEEGLYQMILDIFYEEIE